MLCSWLVLALVAAAQGRAVNISNTWVLPEEGFPVFYRYFRDRISWYEADAVCQFHHANLVTVDTTAQYDAVRAYLKELDISSAVWVGLIRSNPDGDFTWTDYRGLSGDGYWSSAPDTRSAPLCAASNPAADYRWEARACGGPSIASFICELPVPQWALGNDGCMVRALPALTVLYLPESAAVQLTADCGMAGVKRVQCTGNVKHEELIRNLSCTEDEEASPLTSTSPSTVTAWITTEADQETNDRVNEENVTTEHEDAIYTFNSITSTPDLFKLISVTQKKPIVEQQAGLNYNNTIILNKNINLDVVTDNNLQSNDISKLVNHDDFYSTEQLEKQEDEKHIQHKLLHNELARLGNYENIFSQPTDHFVPPLVMAKAKVNDDMTAVSFEEKLAQQHSEYRLTKLQNEINDSLKTNLNQENVKTTIEVSPYSFTTDISITRITDILKDKNEINKNVVPKKYDQTSADIKGKKIVKTIKSGPNTATKMETEGTTLKSIIYFDPSNEDRSLDLTVLIKEPVLTDNGDSNYFNISNTVNITNITKYDTSLEKESNNLIMTQATLIDNESSTESNIMQNVTLNDEIIKITFIQDGDYIPVNSTVFEITTRTPLFKDTHENTFHITTPHASTSVVNAANTITSPSNITNTEEFSSTPMVEINDAVNTTDTALISEPVSNKITGEFSNIEVTTYKYLIDNTQRIEYNINTTEGTSQLIVKETINNITESESLDYFEKSYNNASEDLNDFQSPLLSGASEPLHKPNRSRRPQQPNRIKKFNPFRILG